MQVELQFPFRQENSHFPLLPPNQSLLVSNQHIQRPIKIYDIWFDKWWFPVRKLLVHPMYHDTSPGGFITPISHPLTITYYNYRLWIYLTISYMSTIYVYLSTMQTIDISMDISMDISNIYLYIYIYFCHFIATSCQHLCFPTPASRLRITRRDYWTCRPGGQPWANLRE